MADYIEFLVDDKPYATRKAMLSVADIFSIVGLSASEYYLLSPDGARYADSQHQVEIHSGDHFKTEKRDRNIDPVLPLVIYYKVNGEKLSTTDATLSVEEILRSAGKGASIDLQQLNSYILENISTGKKYENLADIVTIMNDDQFLAVHSGATPVAFPFMR